MAEKGDLQVQETEKQEIMEGDAERIRAGLAFVPRVDIYETADDIVLIADLPGVDADAIDITLEKSIITINAHVVPEEMQDYCLSYAEYRVGDYQRSFTLSDQIDQDAIEATVKDGVLRLHLPKAHPKTKKIAIQAE
ncbi:MAG: Hsp20/alpha crystallin family protein [Anaerolineae bacterium]|nr:Hsp20/alpha crystallin family protein [Anaerolineae bacterium]